MSRKEVDQKRITPIREAGLITAETQVKDFVPAELIDDIRTLQAIRSRLEKYKEKKDLDDGMWPTFSEDAETAMDHITNAIYDMSSIAGSELDYHILNR